MNIFSRRNLLKAGVIGASTAGFSALFGYQQLFAQDGDTVQEIFNLAATAEALASTHYYTALTDSSIQLTPDERYFLLAALDTEHYHLQFLTENGAQLLATAFHMPLNVYRDRQNFSLITAQVESAFVAAYIAANHRIAELGDAPLAATITQIAITEGVHLALIRQLGGLLPNHLALAEALYSTPSEVLPILQPFLEGGDGFSGARPYPGDEAIRTLVGSDGVLAVEPFINMSTSGNT